MTIQSCSALYIILAAEVVVIIHGHWAEVWKQPLPFKYLVANAH